MDSTSPGCSARLPSRARATLLLLVAVATGSCFFSPDQSFVISGRYVNGAECPVVTDGTKTWEAQFGPIPRPPLGAFVVLRVKALHDVASVCMQGEIVQVLRVLRVVTDFRTAPVEGAETWSRSSGPIVLGRVEVRPGATLTIEPGTEIAIIPYGELRVRGTMRMVGVPGDSVRVVGPKGAGAGPVVLDSAGAGTQVAYASLASLVLRGREDGVSHLRALVIRVERGDAGLDQVRTGCLQVDGGRVRVDLSELGGVSAIYGDLEVRQSIFERLDLSYSRATVADSRFVGDRGGIVFHGASGGTFERNAFVGKETTIEVRHTSDPTLTDNDLVSPTTRVVCDSYQLDTCIHMEGNWWGSAAEADVRSHVAGCPVCYTPWRTSPVGSVPRP